MSLLTPDADSNAVVPALPRVISPAAHGVIDYAHAAFFLIVGACLRGSRKRANRRAASVAFATGSFILVQSLLTDYRFGARPVFSFKTHGKMDTLFAAGSWAIPHLFHFSGSPAAAIYEMNSIAEATVIGMTDWDNARAQQERSAA